MTQVYKVVAIDPKSHQYVSYNIGRKIDSPLSLIYAIGQKTTPIFGKLFAFSNYRDAWKYTVACGDGFHRIFLAEATDVTRPNFSVIIGGFSYTDPELVKQCRKFWEGKKSGLSLIGEIYPGTVLCDSITLIRQV